MTQSSDTNNKVTYTSKTDGTSTVAVEGVVSKGVQEGLDNLAQLPFGDKVTGWTAKDSLGGNAKSWTITFTYDANGAITAVAAS